MLQSAGFSRSNPYYIVPQGRITALCNAKDSDRLALLKEVAGTRVYEEHRAESVKILEETDRKREKIVELMQMITERLQELEEERGELEQFLVVDKERKAVEYTLLNRQLNDSNKAIEELAEEEQRLVEDFDGHEKERNIVESQLAQLAQIESQLSEERVQLEEALREKSLLELERDQLIKQVCQLELACDEEEALTVKQEKQIDAQLKSISNDLVKRENEHSRLEQQLSNHISQQDTVKERLEAATAKQAGNKAKATRSNQFKSATERDKWIRQETASLRTTMDLSRRQLASLEEEAKSAQCRHHDLQQHHNDKLQEYQSLMDQQHHHQQAYKQVKEKRDQVVEARKEGWRTEAKLEQTMRTVAEEVDRWEKMLAYSMDRAVFAGLSSLPRLIAALGLQGRVYGPICDLFTCDAVYRQAVESVAGQSLFWVCVDSEDTAVVLMEAMYREECGRLTFVPIASASAASSSDRVPSEGGIRLMDKLQFEDRFERVFYSIFHDTIVVPELDNSIQHDAVTLAGDRQSRRGLVTGGWHDPKRSRLEAVCRLKEWRERQSSCQQQLSAVRQKLAALEQSTCQLTSQLHLLERQQSAQVTVADLTEVERELQNAQAIVSLKQRTISTVHMRINTMQCRIEQLEAELGRPLDDNSNDCVAHELDKEIKVLCEQLEQMSAEESELRTQLAACEDAVRVGKSEQVELLERLTGNTRLQADLLTLQSTRQVLEKTTSRLSELTTIADNHRDASSRLEEAMDKAQSLLLTASSKHSTTADMERFLSRRAHLFAEKESLQRRLCDLGVVSEEAVVKLSRLSTSDLMTMLSELMTRCRQQFAHVNKRAREHSLQYHKQSEELSKRKQDLDHSAAAITDFIHSLDLKKDEAIMRTFTQVSEAFVEVFREMTGGTGSGSLEIVRDGDDLSGVAVVVRGGTDDSTDSADVNVKQLSGGQKSLIALSLILAIQRVDPAPFYLFDEVDAALDAHHRSRLAALLSSDTANKQYIITTFRPELVAIGEQCWGVTGGGRAGSKVDAIGKEIALQFIEHV